MSEPITQQGVDQLAADGALAIGRQVLGREPTPEEAGRSRQSSVPPPGHFPMDISSAWPSMCWPSGGRNPSKSSLKAR